MCCSARITDGLIQRSALLTQTVQQAVERGFELVVSEKVLFEFGKVFGRNADRKLAGEKETGSLDRRGNDADLIRVKIFRMEEELLPGGSTKHFVPAILHRIARSAQGNERKRERDGFDIFFAERKAGTKIQGNTSFLT